MPPGAFRRQAADAAADHADVAGTAREAGSAIKVEGMPACVAKQVSDRSGIEKPRRPHSP
ncbi:hypothetical protein GA0115254_113028 [Streptomyces sp. Ncost-T10-10d]|nr:hypothetical protein GA0115254_113028 [Streptomyces sp. Ncost-T10-10d]